MEMTIRQNAFMITLRSAIADVGEVTGESSSIHLKLRELANSLEFYFENRVLDEAQ